MTRLWMRVLPHHGMPCMQDTGRWLACCAAAQDFDNKKGVMSAHSCVPPLNALQAQHKGRLAAYRMIERRKTVWWLWVLCCVARVLKGTTAAGRIQPRV